jgi:hypothetical protein
MASASTSGEVRDDVVQLQGATAKARSIERGRLRTAAKKANQEPPRTTAMSDPPPRICNRAGLPWGQAVCPEHCQCSRFAEWVGRNMHNKNGIKKVYAARDIENKLFMASDQASYWRPGGHHFKQRHYYSAVLLNFWQIRFPSGKLRIVAEVS